MAKPDEGPAWFKRLGIDRTCRLVAMKAPVVLTATADGEHIVWLYDYPIATGDRATIRARFAAMLGNDWLAKYFA